MTEPIQIISAEPGLYVVELGTESQLTYKPVLAWYVDVTLNKVTPIGFFGVLKAAQWIYSSTSGLIYTAHTFEYGVLPYAFCSKHKASFLPPPNIPIIDMAEALRSLEYSVSKIGVVHV